MKNEKKDEQLQKNKENKSIRIECKFFDKIFENDNNKNFSMNFVTPVKAKKTSKTNFENKFNNSTFSFDKSPALDFQDKPNISF